MIPLVDCEKEKKNTKKKKTNILIVMVLALLCLLLIVILIYRARIVKEENEGPEAVSIEMEQGIVEERAD